MSNSIWDLCISCLQSELPAQQFNTWIRPLTAETNEDNTLRLVAPNRFVSDWVTDKYKNRIEDILRQSSGQYHAEVQIVVSNNRRAALALSKEAPRSNSVTRVENTSTDSMQTNVNRVDVSDINGASQFDRSASVNHAAPIVNQLDLGNDSSWEESNPDNYSINPKDNATSLDSTLAASLSSPSGINNGHDINLLDRSLNINGVGSELRVKENNNTNDFVQNHSDSLLTTPSPSPAMDTTLTSENKSERLTKSDLEGGIEHKSNLNTSFTFDNFVVGKSNQLGLAAASQVAENPGGAYNPLFIYGGVGLGKTHLMHAVGNALMQSKPGAKVVYLHSERFVADMVKALQLNAINDFKRFYRSVDALLIDDIQFFAGKDRSQEEFFHTFNALLEGGHQIIVTSDRYPKEIEGLEERLKSRFGWGLTVAIEPPELETRVAILKRKADQVGMVLPNEAAFFIAQRIRSNVRELEGTLKRVIANAHFTGREISVELVRESLKDLLALQDRLVSIDNIQRVVGEYYKIKIADLLSKRRSRSVARPRQVAMYLAKDLTNHSLPEIGDAFGGRDHTTVLHACRKIKELLESDADIKEDVKNLLRTLTT